MVLMSLLKMEGVSIEYINLNLCVDISIYVLVYLHRHLYTYKIYLNEDMIASTEISLL